MVAMDINDTKRKRTLLLHYAGNDVDDIFKTRNVGEDYQDKHYFATNKLSEYFALIQLLAVFEMQNNNKMKVLIHSAPVYEH